MKPLTPKQEKFAQLVADGKTQADAYRGSFDASKSTDKSIIESASKLMSNINIVSRVDSLRQELSNRALWTREESVKTLKSVIENPEKATDIIAAVKELNAMHGYNAPIKLDVEYRGSVNLFIPEQSEDE
jgi:hypothetical protein